MKYFTKNSIQKLQPGGYFITPNNPPSDIGNYPGVRPMQQRQQMLELQRQKEEAQRKAELADFEAWAKWMRGLPYNDPRKVYVLTMESFKQWKEDEAKRQAAEANRPQIRQGRSASEEKQRQKQKQQENLQRSYDYQYSQLYGNMGMPNTAYNQAAVQLMPYAWQATKDYFSNPARVLDDVSQAVLTPFTAPVAEPMAVRRSIEEGDTKGAVTHSIGFGLSMLPFFGMKSMAAPQARPTTFNSRPSSVRVTPRTNSPSTFRRAIDQEAAWEQRTFNNASQRVNEAFQSGNQALQDFRQWSAQQRESFGSTLGPQPEYSLVGGGAYRGGNLGFDFNSRLYQPSRQMNMYRVERQGPNGEKITERHWGKPPKEKPSTQPIKADNTLAEVYESRQFPWSKDEPIQFTFENTYRIDNQPLVNGAKVAENHLDDYLKVQYEDGSYGYVPRNQYVPETSAKPQRVIREEGGIDPDTPIQRIITDDGSGAVEVELSDGRTTILSKDNIAPEVLAKPATAGGRNIFQNPDGTYATPTPYTGKVRVVTEPGGKATAFYDDGSGNFISTGGATLTEAPVEAPIGTEVPSGTKVSRFNTGFGGTPTSSRLPNRMYQGLWRSDLFGNRTTFWGRHPIFTTVGIPTALGITGHALFGGSLLNDLGWFGGQVQEGAAGGNFYEDMQNNKAKENQAVLDSLRRAAEIKDSTDKAEKQRIQEEEEYWKRQDSLKNEWRNLNQNQDQNQ